MENAPINDLDVLEQLLRMRTSANIVFYKQALYSLLKEHVGLFYKSFEDEEATRRIIDVIVQSMKSIEHLEGIENLERIAVHFKSNPSKKLRATILEIPNPSFEPECNFVAIAFCPEDGFIQLHYYLSELYEEGCFGLCEQKSDGTHLNFGGNYGDIQTVDDLWLAIDSRL